VDRWIFSRLATVTREMNEALAGYRFHEAAYTIYHFFWHELCDWYLEWVKPEITRPSEEPKASAAAINLARVFEAALHLLHPFMPFITEELWHQLPRSGDARSISLTRFELVNPRAADPVSEKQYATIQELIVAARNIKAEMGLQKEKPSAQVASEDTRLLELFRSHQEAILRLAGLEALNFVRGRMPADASPVPLASGCDLRLFYERAIDPVAERARIERDLAKMKQQLEQIERQLANESFRSRAPQEVVAGAERRRAEITDRLERLGQSLSQL
jgi:valyl-tRNA synthetase